MALATLKIPKLRSIKIKELITSSPVSLIELPSARNIALCL